MLRDKMGIDKYITSTFSTLLLCGIICFCYAIDEIQHTLTEAEKDMKSANQNGDNDRICPSGKIYMDCGDPCQPTCEIFKPCEGLPCVRGCFCPDGTVLDHTDNCITIDQCPCHYNGNYFSPGMEFISINCRKCVCDSGGRFNCTDLEICNATCTVYGDSYSTFDGKRYKFMGVCSYYLMHDDTSAFAYDIVAENFPRRGGRSTFIKSIQIVVSSFTVSLDRHGTVSADGNPISLPFTSSGIKVDAATSPWFTEAVLQNGISILWGKRGLNITVPATLTRLTRGMCGTFDQDPNNDFETRDGRVLPDGNVNEFGESWASACSET